MDGIDVGNSAYCTLDFDLKIQYLQYPQKKEVLNFQAKILYRKEVIFSSFLVHQIPWPEGFNIRRKEG